MSPPDSICSDQNQCIDSVPHQGSWLAILSITLSAFALVTGEFLAVGVLNEIAQDFRISIGTAGWTVTITAITGMFASLLIPLSAKSLDRRYLLLILTLMMVIANLLTALASNFALVLVARFILGIAIGGFWATAVALSGRVAPANLPIAKATALVASGVTLASVLGVPIGTWLSHYASWRTAFMVITVMGVVLFFIQLRYLPQLKPSSALKLKELPALIRHPIARKGWIIFIFIGLAHFAAYSYFAPFFKFQLGFSDGFISSLLLIYGASGILGNAFAGYMGQINIRYTFAFSAIAMAIGFLGLPFFAIHIAGAILLTAIWGFAWGIIPTAVNIWMFIHAPEDVEKGMPMITFTFLILIALGSGLGGIIVDHFNGNVLLLSILPLVLCSILLIFTFAKGINNPH
ncbi:MFS transporter [Acinetobacter qingfengensis]|uniref:MFS transporter n=1 Tax=Acinetobacter qingfengensis TaxID=1262585 RepID=A0A1E7RCV9_9GAMM|nr:MFS transporter [Acinetobacter qingfengensis]KAA8732091.1 MFS transporter [Acinetobacter qingfengensis]OEY97171.1 MFS transporter [Acinetobacter qingfengensis]